jgi:transcriptional regulator GlxA family with amidase domain
MCQVGDRLIPVGVGRIQTPEEAAAEATDVPESRRSRRRQQQQNGNFEQFVGTGNQDLEEVSILLQRNLVSQLTGYELANAYGSDAFIADRS